jgi:hypothetical protein
MDPKSLKQDVDGRLEAFRKFHEKLAGNATTATAPFVRNLTTLPSFALVIEEDATAAAEQVLLLARYLKLKHWSGLMACCLINGVIPVEGDLDGETGVQTFDNRRLSLGSSPVQHMRRDHREWRDSEQNTGLVDYVEFFRWCEEEGIDTNYLRLLREIAGCGAGKTIGRLPLADVERFDGN